MKITRRGKAYILHESSRNESYFFPIWTKVVVFRKNIVAVPSVNCNKGCPVETALFHADRRTDMTQPIFAFCQCFPNAAKTLLNVKFCQILSIICVCVIQAVFTFPCPVPLNYVFVCDSNTKKMNLNSSSRSSSQIHQTQCRDQWKMWASRFPAVTQCQSHILTCAKTPHVGILHRRLRMLRERYDRAAKCSAPLIYKLTNDPVFNDVPLTIQMGQFAVNPETQSWRD